MMMLEDKAMTNVDIIYNEENKENSNRPDIFKAVTKSNLKKSIRS